MATQKEGPVAQPSMANGAQVPLYNFEIPQFPREAGGLMALTLTSQIGLNEYNEVLKRPFKVTHLPPSIQSLTLELFALGYPAGFLKALIAELPELRSLVVYSQLFTGNSAETSDDAVTFIKGAKKLRGLHLLDALVSPEFIKGIAPFVKELEKPLMFIEINYTSRSDDEASMKRIPAAELPFLVHHGLISCSFNIAPPDAKGKSVDTTNRTADGIQTLDSKLSQDLLDRLLQDESAPKVMKHLNITLYPITIGQLRRLIEKHTGLMVLNVSIEVKDNTFDKDELFKALFGGKNLEQVEIVLCPSFGAEDLDLTIKLFEIEALSKPHKKLTSLKINQRRCQRSRSSVECSLFNEKWQINMKKAQVENISGGTKSVKPKKKEAWSPWT